MRFPPFPFPPRTNAFPPSVFFHYTGIRAERGFRCLSPGERVRCPFLRPSHPCKATTDLFLRLRRSSTTSPSDRVPENTRLSTLPASKVRSFPPLPSSFLDRPLTFSLLSFYHPPPSTASPIPSLLTLRCSPPRSLRPPPSRSRPSQLANPLPWLELSRQQRKASSWRQLHPSLRIREHGTAGTGGVQRVELVDAHPPFLPLFPSSSRAALPSTFLVLSIAPSGSFLCRTLPVSPSSTRSAKTAYLLDPIRRSSRHRDAQKSHPRCPGLHDCP